MPICNLSWVPEIIVYTMPGCPQCKQTKRWLDNRNIYYDEIDVTTDREAYLYITDTLGYRQAPVVEVDREVHWSGFNKENLEWFAQCL